MRDIACNISSDQKVKRNYESVKENIKRVTVTRTSTTEIQGFLSTIIVIIIKRILMYSFSILNKIFKEGKKLRTSLEMAKYGLEETLKSLKFSHCESAVLN